MSAENPTVRSRRRAEIIAEARKLVAEGGLEAMTIAALEERLSFTRGVITYHFENKAEIVEAVLDSAIAEINDASQTAIHASASFPEKLQAMVKQTVQGFLRHREAARILISFWARIPVDPHAAGLNARLYTRYREAAVKLLKIGQSSGHVRADADLHAVAAVIVATVIGVVTQVYFEQGSIDPDNAVSESIAGILLRLA
ncbi:MAG: TetR/AcrR family transcriptional regulator [Myxococcales bacterium]|nr:TetR/AcrR family transcriptional regulator [Myxococcales bacterium]MCB9732092.1 TetR/AcrR family transcriptional regulator [Deltaproteobacteria bacterium]